MIGFFFLEIFNEIFIESDPYSHLNDYYFLNNFLPHVLAKID